MNPFRDCPSMPYGSNPAAATSSSFLLLLGRRFLLFCRLRCRFIGASPRVVGLAGVTHIRDLLACAIYTEIISTSSLFCQHGWPKKCTLVQIQPLLYCVIETGWVSLVLTARWSTWLVLLQSGLELRYVILSGLPSTYPREHHSLRRNRLSSHP
jgi:hypothetical protein